jgi:CheY-like chemotaxis protein
MDPVVLIVDDNDDNRFTLSMRLETCGYGNIVTAENGREALEKMRSGPIDLVLLDIMMPEMKWIRDARAFESQHRTTRYTGNYDLGA